MRFVHLSDLHLGKNVNNYSMIKDQKYMLDEVLNIVDKKDIKAVLISGDVYDKSIATTEAIKLYDYFNEELVKRNIKVLTIAGNHDSAVRLGTCSSLVEKSGVYVSKDFDGEVKKVSLQDEFGNINFYLLPFIKPINVKQIYKLEDSLSYTDSVKFVIDKLDLNEDERNIILSHQFVVGATLSGSEDIITVGGVDSVEASVYEKFDYVALGHIHKAQDVVKNKIRYPGTLLKYSFGELNNKKTLTIVEMKEKGDISFEEIEVTPIKDFAELKGEFKQLTNPSFYNTLTDSERERYYRIILTDEDEIPDVYLSLIEIYPFMMELKYDNSRTKFNNILTGASDVETKKPIELVSEFYVKQNNLDLSEKQLNYLNKQIERIWEEE